MDLVRVSTDLDPSYSFFIAFYFIHIIDLDKGLSSLRSVEWINSEDLDREVYPYEDSVQVKRDHEFALFK